MSRSTQRSFNPAHIEFYWTKDGWYEWDSAEAHKLAKQERDAVVRAARKQGRKVKCWANKGQLITKGGIGTECPEISLRVTVYHVEIGPEPVRPLSLVNAWGAMLYGARC